MCQTNYKCRNCASTSKSLSETCSKCGMKGMLVEVQAESIESKPTIKKIFTSCVNCGTTEMGNGHKCQMCHFPKREEKKAKQTLKVKTS